MEIIENKIQVSKSAFYYTNGELTENTKYVWIVCHGYAQRADHIIKKFDILDPDIHHIVSVEGLSKFYWKGVTGEVVSSWMTKKNRLEEIEDYSNYLSSILHSIKEDANADCEIIGFGFSQGSATIFRWVHRHQPALDHIISYAGWIPEDIDFVPLQSYLADIKITHLVGDQDEYLNPKRKSQLVDIAEKNNIYVNFIKYEGNHSIDREILKTQIVGRL